jgi:murein DD-endopeptidase MepM/ murein hydrolase activator NlpD
MWIFSMFKKLFLLSFFTFFVFLLSNEYFNWIEYNQTASIDFRLSKNIDKSLESIPKNTLTPIPSTKNAPNIINEVQGITNSNSVILQSNVIYIDILPKVINSGEFFMVRIDGDINQNTSVFFLDKIFPVFGNKLDGYSTFIGVPLNTAEGTYEITLSKTPNNKTIFTNNNTVQILKKDRGFDYISLSNEILSSSFSDDSLKIDSEIRSEASRMFSVSQYWTGPFDIPCAGDITTMFGVGRSYNKQPISSYHLGLDIGAKKYEKIFAPASGVIKRVDDSPLRGVLVYLDHGAGVQSSFAHLNSTLVSAGDIVRRGDLIGLVGSSGASTGPHLHWEVSVWGVLTDPLSWTQSSLF